MSFWSLFGVRGARIRDFEAGGGPDRIFIKISSILGSILGALGDPWESLLGDLGHFWASQDTFFVVFLKSFFEGRFFIDLR